MIVEPAQLLTPRTLSNEREPDPRALLQYVDVVRLGISARLDPQRRSQWGQFFTPVAIARLMASMPTLATEHISLLDAGAGVGSLTGAFVAEMCARPQPPKSVHVTAYEIDAVLLPHLSDTISFCHSVCGRYGIDFSSEIRQADFLLDAASMVLGDLFHPIAHPRPNVALLNPPYGKMRSRSNHRLQLRRLGIETSNLYTAFLAVAMQLLCPEGELVTITPRSFCNGPYFRPFRRSLLTSMALRRIHLFSSRQQAFADDDVLQENVILHAVKGAPQPAQVTISSSSGSDDGLMSLTHVPFTQVRQPEDPEAFLRIADDEQAVQVAGHMAKLETSLVQLNLSVSTGKVVEFRARDLLQLQPGPNTIPLIFPFNLRDGSVEWPLHPSRKSQALSTSAHARGLTVPNGHYVLVKRFSAKEEPKRIVAAVHQADRFAATEIGIENHLNYFHRHGKGLDLLVARGLAAFLNASIVDDYFRQFNGHTQVNATDLRSLRYPTESQLHALGIRIGQAMPDQAALDRIVEREIFEMADTNDAAPLRTSQRVAEARDVLTALGLPAAQQNERSALTLLALLDLPADRPWAEAAAPLRGITQMMGFFTRQYGKSYAPNSRETVRRQTVHQFLDAGLIVVNPDDPSRAINSGKTVYQIEQGALDLLRTFGSGDWDTNLTTYLASVETLQQRYRQARDMVRIPIQIDEARSITLSAGGQNILIEQIVSEFAPRFTPGGRLLYVGDADEKFAYYDSENLAALGVVIEAHGKMPDVIVHHSEKDWLILVEAVTSHGPISPKRHQELQHLFALSRAGLVFVTAFLTRRAMVGYLSEISWETDVWLAETPDHLIHFNGERFLGPTI